MDYVSLGIFILTSIGTSIATVSAIKVHIQYLKEGDEKHTQRLDSHETRIRALEISK
jgi:hypothetical protein